MLHSSLWVFLFTFTFMHLADAFIQSDLQCIQAIQCLYACSLGIEPTTFALLTQCSTTEPQEHRTSSVWVGGKPKVQHPLHRWCWDCSCLNAFLRWHFTHFVFSLNKLNLTESMAADDYLNWILPKCTLVSVR